MAESGNLSKYAPSDYSPQDRLFRGYRLSDINEGTQNIEANAISFPDFSCNWNRFASPGSIRDRDNGLPTDGCYSFTVEVAQYGKMATPCHDPIEGNYSHTEVRQLTEEEPVSFEPPKKRKLESHNWSKSKRREYRQNIVNNLHIEIQATA
ncbi:MAG TPA: hypothetical protein VHO70_02520 [Chitinispirillaceae bacterium]|nr:hypothetical protein [Chitinispirillaceae bacterium]